MKCALASETAALNTDTHGCEMTFSTGVLRLNLHFRSLFGSQKYMGEDGTWCLKEVIMKCFWTEQT